MAIDLSTLMPQQREVATTLDRPLFVSAGAGSGKTFTLTRRILWALSPESGPFIEHLDQVLAITFTTDAAAEIRERVRAALIEAGMDEEALTVDDAWISTIHGMCSRILRANALELGIDPEFAVASELEADELRQQAIDHVLARAAAGLDEAGARTRPYAALLEWYRLQSDAGGFGSGGASSVHDLVSKVLERACALPGGMSDVHMARGAVDFSALRDAYRALLSGTATQVEIARTAMEALDAFEDGPRDMRALARCMMSCGVPRAAGKVKEQVALLKAEFADAFLNAAVAVGAPALDELMDLAHQVEREFRRLKAERCLLDNNDLLRLAFEAFRDHESLRRAFEGRFSLVMIDEFQDTDQQQVDLIGYLTGAGGRALCTVGDAQQSIYRFRGADVEVFRRQQRRIEAQAAAALGAPGEPAASAAGVPITGETAATAPGAAGQPGAPADAAPCAGAAARQAEAAPAGRLVKLVRNFRSHAEILAYVARVFDGREGRGGLMPDFLDLEPSDTRADGLKVPGASRRQAVLAVGAGSQACREAKAAAIAQRFRALADAGQPVGGMVLLLGTLVHADAYADAFRVQGLDCVIAGGSVFSATVEARTVRALARALANPLDGSEGLLPLLTSPMFALGAQELLAVATAWDPETGSTRRRNLDAGIWSDDDAPGFGELPLLACARRVLRLAWRRVAADGMAATAREVVRESGWLVRLVARGAEGRAAAANVLKALDALEAAERACGRAPRQTAEAFDDFLAGKEAPGALNEGAGSAVRIMTVHASKGLEFPVVAVADCFDARPNADLMQLQRAEAGLDAVALPDRFPAVRAADGSFHTADAVRKRFRDLYSGSKPWLPAELMDDVCATGSIAERFIGARDESARKDLEERARLLYVAMTRAREVLILAMDASWAANSRAHEVKFNAERDLTGRVLELILGGTSLDADRLAFDGAQAGDFELLALDDFTYDGASYACTVSAVEDDPAAASPGPASPDADHFTLVHTDGLDWRVRMAPASPRDAYSYSSVAAQLHAEVDDRAGTPAAVPGNFGDGVDSFAASEAPNARGTGEDAAVVRQVPSEDAGAAGSAAGAEASRAAVPRPDADPVALGSAFHAAAQWLVEMGADEVPAARIDALSRQWGCTSEQRERLVTSLARWEASEVRAQALTWPQVRAEVPFFSRGAECLTERFGAFAQGAIDLLCTDPADRSQALVIDYKTGGSAEETPEQLREKHDLQATVYADVLHRAGYAQVRIAFVRVEQPDASDPAQPQVVWFEK